jgi:hypothetical protein
MPKLAMSVPHALGQQEAIARVHKFSAKVKERHPDQVKDLVEEWKDNTLAFSLSNFGFKIKGLLTVEETELKVDCDLPFAAAMFKGKIEREFRETLTRVLETRKEEPA